MLRNGERKEVVAQIPDFIANGETAVVRRVRRTRELYGFRFADVTLAFPDYNDLELEVNLLLDTLHSDAPALPKADNDRLFLYCPRRLRRYYDEARKNEEDESRSLLQCFTGEVCLMP